MLKMTIDNEEVVSKNNFTIKEEMQTASSTILNNTYPKSWEQDKDYTSRFYYPKDYAKLNIQNFTRVQEAEAGTTVQINGSAILTDVDTTKNSRVLSLKGQTSQTGTPTPSSPIPVNVVSGDNSINVYGKNLFSGLLSQFDNQGGTGTAYYYFKLPEGKTYTLSAIAKNDVSITGNYYIGMTYNGGNSTGGIAWLLAKGASYTKGQRQVLTTNVNRRFVSIYTNTQETLDYLTENFDIMLEESATATTYEPYVGSTYPIYLGVENIFNVNNIILPSTAYSVVGNEITINNSVSDFYSYNFLPNTPYTISFDLKQATGSGNGRLQFYYSDGTTETIGTNNTSTYQTITKTSNSAKTLQKIQTSYGSAGSFTIKDVKFTKSDHIQHISTTPIELCKIGNYQDMIFKNTLDSPYYDSNFDTDKWLLHKEIGKVVLDGTENTWGYSGAQTAFYVDITNNVSGNRNVLVCDKYICVVESSGTTMPNNTIMVNANNNNRLVIKDTRYTDTTTYKTWLVNNNVIVYHPLATPTTTQITDTTLINQLDNLESS